MKPAPFAYVRTGSVEEACEQLHLEGDAARILAGGQSLGAMLNMRIATPALLIDINRVPGLDRIEEMRGGIATGATVRQVAALASPSITNSVPLLAAALPHVGHYQTRSRGTLAGSAAHADPSAEIPLVLAVLGGSVELASRKGPRRVAARDFFVSALTTRRAAEEMVVRLHWPTAEAGDFFGFREQALRAGDYALVAAACRARRSRSGKIEVFEIGFAGCGERPQIVSGRAIVDGGLSPAAIDALAEEASGTVECRGDLHASATYRRHLIGVLCRQLAHEASACFEKADHDENRC